MPRTHHYVFAHIALRQLFFLNPTALVAALIKNGDQLLTQLWDEVGKKVVEKEGKAARLSSTGLSRDLAVVGQSLFAAVVTLPTPQEVPEAYFVGMVVNVPSEEPAWEPHGEVARYVTLEYGLGLMGGSRTVLCEWIKDTHANMGDGPDANIADFTETLKDLLRK